MTRNLTVLNRRVQNIKDILGDDFVAPSEVQNRIGRVVDYRNSWTETSGRNLPGERFLKICLELGMIIVPGPPKRMFLVDVIQCLPHLFYRTKGGLFSLKRKQRFIREEHVSASWLVLGKEPFPDSSSHPWYVQENQVRQPLMIPNAVTLAWGIAVYNSVRRANLYSDFSVRTSSLDCSRQRVNLTYVKNDRIPGGGLVSLTDDFGDTACSPKLGVAFMWSF